MKVVKDPLKLLQQKAAVTHHYIQGSLANTETALDNLLFGYKNGKERAEYDEVTIWELILLQVQQRIKYL